MRIPRVATASAVIVLSGICFAASPYVGQDAREIKALSESEVADLLAGKGMGYAKAAELNGYPGPAHVIELAAQLQLTPEQLNRTRDIHARMEAAAKAAGASLVAAERELDVLFRSHTVTSELMATALKQIAEAEARVRGAHLAAHIEQTSVLSPEQITQYSELRGYRGATRHLDHAHPNHRSQH